MGLRVVGFFLGLALSAVAIGQGSPDFFTENHYHLLTNDNLVAD